MQSLPAHFARLGRALAVLMCLGVFAAPAAFAHAYKAGALDIHHPWARPTTGQTGAVYFVLKNGGTTDDALLRVETDVADKAQIHTMTMDGTVMRMRELDKLDIPAGKTVAVAPGGIHVMLIGLKAPLKSGDKFPMKLVFEKAGSVEVSVYVQTPEEMRKGEENASGGAGMSDMPGMEGMH
ncbi:copper chaperone PCu(A)C [Parvibaculum sp.]|uniref:copper chaperone PCu(A)C n=1 Tax=Parvibaculum sp. TaxID=2024848 RepID=UPI00320DF8CA